MREKSVNFDRRTVWLSMHTKVCTTKIGNARYFVLYCTRVISVSRVSRAVYVTIILRAARERLNVPRSNGSWLTYANVCMCIRENSEYPAIYRELVQTVYSRSVVWVRLLLSYLASVFCCIPGKLETYIERACCIFTHYARDVTFVTRNVVNTNG